MTTIQYPAIEIRQNGVSMYLLSMSVGDLLQLTTVDEWDPDLDPDDPDYLEVQGYQRKASPRHYTNISKFVSQADAILPTCLLLSSREPLTFTRSDRESSVGNLVLNGEEQELWVVDGQHRLQGLQHAIRERNKVDLHQMMLPVSILSDVEKFAEMNQFYIVNSKQKGVRADLADQLMTMKETQEPGSVRDELSAAKRWRLEATPLTRMMNQQEGSPWSGKIQAPNSPKGDTIITHRSFSTSLKPILQDSSMQNYPLEEIAYWLSLFWGVVRDLMPGEVFMNPREYAVQKTPGVYTFHMLVPRIFGIWLMSGKDGAAGIREILTDNDDLAFYFTEEECWRSGSGDCASVSGLGGFGRLADDISQFLPEARMPELR